MPFLACRCLVSLIFDQVLFFPSALVIRAVGALILAVLSYHIFAVPWDESLQWRLVVVGTRSRDLSEGGVEKGAVVPFSSLLNADGHWSVAGIIALPFWVSPEHHYHTWGIYVGQYYIRSLSSSLVRPWFLFICQWLWLMYGLRLPLSGPMTKVRKRRRTFETPRTTLDPWCVPPSTGLVVTPARGRVATPAELSQLLDSAA